MSFSLKRALGLKIPAPPSSQPLLDQVNSAKTEQQGIVNSGAQKVAGLYDPANPNGASALTQSLLDSIKQRTLGALPEQQEALKESLAGAGQFGNGTATRALSDLSRSTMANLEDNSANTLQQGMASRLAAMNNLYTGQTNNLLGISENAGNQTLDINQNANDMAYARKVAQAQNAGRLTSSLVNGAAAVGGAAFGGPVGKAVVKSAMPAVDGSLTQALLNRGYQPGKLSLYGLGS